MSARSSRKEETYLVERIEFKRSIGGEPFYWVWWAGDDAIPKHSWEPATNFSAKDRRAADALDSLKPLSEDDEETERICLVVSNSC